MKVNKKIVSFLLAFTMLISISIAPVNAAVTDYITEKDDKVFVYDLDDLLSSATDKALGLEAPLYERFLTEEVALVYDDVKGYVSIDDVIDALVDAKLDGKEFNLDEFTEKEAIATDDPTGDLYKVNLDGTETPVEKEPEEELKVVEISAITTQINAVAGEQLDFEMETNKGVKTVKDLAELKEAGYTVTFLATDNTNVTPAGVAEGSAIGDGKSFEYQVVVKDAEGNVVKESELVEVTVKDYSKVVTEITESTVVFNDDVKLTSGTVVAGEKVVIKDIKGYKKDDLKTEITLQTEDIKVESSDVTKAIANVTSNASSAAEVTLTLPGGTGDVAITITAGDVEHVVNLNVVSEAREPKTATFDKDAIRVVNGATQSVVATVVDQYGDLVKGFKPAAIDVKNASDESILTFTPNTITAEATDENGKVTIAFVADAENVGTGTVELKDGTTILGTLPVEVGEATEVAYRTIEFASDSVSDDFELDKYTTDEYNDSTLTVVWNKYNADDILIGAETAIGTTGTTGTKYIVESSDPTVASVTVESSKIKVTAEAEGTATITIKEGSITRESFDVTVVDTTPAAASIALAEGVKEIEIAADATELKFDDIKDNFVILDQFGETLVPNDTDVTYFTDNAAVIDVTTANTISAATSVEVGKTANLIVKVNGHVINVPVKIVEAEGTTTP